MRAFVALVVWLNGVALGGCATDWNEWRPQTVSTGWHACDYAGTRGCPEWYVCVSDGCEYFGDPNGPGPGDTASQSDPPSR